MKAFVDITGQPFGNELLKNRIQFSDGIYKNKRTDNGYRIYFKTIKQAKKALYEAYKTLIMDEPQMKGKMGGIYFILGENLMYDASSAIMYRNN